MIPLLLAMAQNSTASLVLSAESVAPGSTFTAAIQIKMEPGWHTYWRNPGDSGSAPTVKWQLPQGWRVGSLRWPLPKRHKTPEGTDFIYEDQVLFLAEITAPVAGSRPSNNNTEVPIPVPPTATLKAKVSWLVCQEACVPASADVSATISVGASRPSKSADQLAELIRAIPARVLDGWTARSVPNGVEIVRTDGSEIEPGTFFLPGDAGVFDHSDAGSISADKKTLTIKRSPYASAPPKRLRGVIVLPSGSGRDIDMPISS